MRRNGYPGNGTWTIILLAVMAMVGFRMWHGAKVNRELRSHYVTAKAQRVDGRAETIDQFLRRTGSKKTREVYLPKVREAFSDLNPRSEGPLEAGRDYKVPNLP